MLPFRNAILGQWTAVGTQAALHLDFAAGEYRSGGTRYAALSDLPGHSFTRTGEQGAVDSAGAVSYFAANVPAINDRGYHAYGALTNYALRSQELDQSPWQDATTVANQSTAPDGTLSADRVDLSTGPFDGDRQQLCGSSAFANKTFTFSVFAKTGEAVDRKIRIKATHASVLDYRSPDFTAGSEWQRFAFTQSYGSGGIGSWAGVSTSSTDGKIGIVDLWQFQLIEGTFPDGGPIIRTAGATASIGASVFSVSLPNGSYTATYTFDDDTTQDVAVTVSSGVFFIPTDGTLNRNVIKSVTIS